MITTCVYVEVRIGYVDAFIAETTKNHLQSVKEKGNLRFDVLQDSENPNKFMLYEAYKSEEDAVAHKTTLHYQEWKNAVEIMMAQPRKGVKYGIICPAE